MSYRISHILSEFEKAGFHIQRHRTGGFVLNRGKERIRLVRGKKSLKAVMAEGETVEVTRENVGQFLQ